MYTEFPGSITPITSTPNAVLPTPVPTPFTTTKQDGEVDVYPSQLVHIGHVYSGVKATYTEGAGSASTVVPAAPTEVSGNNKGSGVCHSTGDACNRAWVQFEDDRVYTDYAAYGADVYAFLLQGLTFGKGRCIAQFECEDYGLGMSGRQIKDAYVLPLPFPSLVFFISINSNHALCFRVENLKEEHDVDKCGTTYLSNTCHITLNYCTDCDTRQ